MSLTVLALLGIGAVFLGRGFGLRTAYATVASSVLLPELAMDGGHIAVDRDMRTSLPGVFACGDCTGRPYQIAKAVGEGNMAALSADAFIKENDT